MYNVFKNRIAAGGFKLADIQYRIKKLFALGDLTEEQMDELMALTQQMADPEAERPEILKMLRALSDRLSAVEKKMADQSDTEEDLPEYEEWVQPVAGLTDKYQYSAIVSHNGELWESIYRGQNVWEPGTPGTEALWVKHTLTEEE